MWLQYYGHSAFRLTTDEGVDVCLDPYRAGGYEGAMGYAPISDHIDVVALSHEHDDHAAYDTLVGEPLVVRGSCHVRDMDIEMIPAWHDAQQGALRGKNNMMRIAAGGLCVLHCGDLGHVPTDEQRAAIGNVDVLLVPVGGTYTLDAAQATETMRLLTPQVTIPMHYKTVSIGFPLEPVDAFLADKAEVRRHRFKPDDPGIELTPDTLPTQPCVYYLEPSHVSRADDEEES